MILNIVVKSLIAACLYAVSCLMTPIINEIYIVQSVASESDIIGMVGVGAVFVFTVNLGAAAWILYKSN